VGKIDGGSTFLDSTLSTIGAGTAALPIKWNILASSSILKIIDFPDFGKK